MAWDHERWERLADKKEANGFCRAFRCRRRAMANGWCPEHDEEFESRKRIMTDGTRPLDVFLTRSNNFKVKWWYDEMEEYLVDDGVLEARNDR